MQEKIIKQGDSLDFDTRLSGEDMSFFTCQLQVRDFITNALLVDKAITDISADNRLYRGRLTATESASLAVGSYKMSTQLTRAGTDQAKEICIKLIIEEQCNF